MYVTAKYLFTGVKSRYHRRAKHLKHALGGLFATDDVLHDAQIDPRRRFFDGFVYSQLCHHIRQPLARRGWFAQISRRYVMEELCRLIAVKVDVDGIGAVNDAKTATKLVAKLVLSLRMISCITISPWRQRYSTQQC